MDIGTRVPYFDVYVIALRRIEEGSSLILTLNHSCSSQSEHLEKKQFGEDVRRKRVEQCICVNRPLRDATGHI